MSAAFNIWRDHPDDLAAVDQSISRSGLVSPAEVIAFVHREIENDIGGAKLVFLERTPDAYLYRMVNGGTALITFKALASRVRRTLKRREAAKANS